MTFMRLLYYVRIRFSYLIPGSFGCFLISSFLDLPGDNAHSDEDVRSGFFLVIVAMGFFASLAHVVLFVIVL